MPGPAKISPHSSRWFTSGRTVSTIDNTLVHVSTGLSQGGLRGAMTQKFTVAIVLRSPSRSLNEIDSLLGAGGGGSHDKAEIRHDGRIWKTTTWRKHAKDSAASLLEQSM